MGSLGGTGSQQPKLTEPAITRLSGDFKTNRLFFAQEPRVFILFLNIKIKSPAISIRLEIFGEFVLFVFRPDTLGKFYPPLLFVDLLTIFYDFYPALAFARTQRIKSVND